ncbi:MAG: DUF4230 domain-containing protein [Lachnospiraceae bacterium]|nr:DUF4230 domain-containing protein [Lachnospiraceae bacterium]
MCSNDNEKVIIKMLKYKKRFIVLLLLCIIIILFKVILDSDSFSDRAKNTAKKLIEGEEGKVTTISKASLDKVFEISELATADYIYNAVAKSYEEDGETVKYYVAYESTVKAGIDFSKLLVDINETGKIIKITIPDIEFQEKTVDPGTLNYIFKDEKYETENVHQEAFELCERDLEQRIANEKNLLELAEKNAIAIIKALVLPWVQQIDNGYQVIVSSGLK